MERLCKYFPQQSLKMMELGEKLETWPDVRHVATGCRCALQHGFAQLPFRAGLSCGINFLKGWFLAR